MCIYKQSYLRKNQLQKTYALIVYSYLQANAKCNLAMQLISLYATNPHHHAVSISMQDPVPSELNVHTDTLVVIAHPRQPARESLHTSPQQIIRTLELNKALVSILALAETHTLASLGVLIAV